MRSIVVDAGPMIALFDRRDAHHAAASAFLERTETCRLVTTPIVVGEVAAMLSDVRPSAIAFLNWLNASVEIDETWKDDLLRTIEIMKKYADLPADLADASLVALCERRQVHEIASIDRDFDIYRLPKGKRFHNVFLS